MSLVYPGLVNIDNSSISVTTVNVYDHSTEEISFDLSGQIPDHDAEAKHTFTLPSPCKANTLMVFLDGMLLSSYSPAEDAGDYDLVNNSQFTIRWHDGIKKQSEDDTPVLIVRYQTLSALQP